MAFWAYLLRCSDGRYYTGHTDNLDRRMAEHQAGGFCAFTSKRQPVALMWSETFQTRIEALEAERIVSGWSRPNKEALIRGDRKTLSFFAKPPSERFSTTLGTNGDGVGNASKKTNNAQPPLVSSVVEKLIPTHQPPFVSSEVEKPAPTAAEKPANPQPSEIHP
jgi:putative endonuclease